MIHFGWWTTGRDEAALGLFDAVRSAVEDGVIPGDFAYVFCSRAPGESEFSDTLIKRVQGLGLPMVNFSASAFEPALRQSDKEAWRRAYHAEVLKRIEAFGADMAVLAGYMWVVSPEVCERLSVINLHPAAPGGPAGTWQEVIWQLLESRAAQTGVMMHLVTPELDEGPPVTYCTFPIRGGAWDGLWAQFEAECARLGLPGVKAAQGEAQPLFAAIRREGVRRELPLIVQTLRAFGLGEVTIRGGNLVDGRGHSLDGPYDLTRAIEASLADE